MAVVTVAVVTVAVVTVDATAEAVGMEAVDPEWEEAACLDLVKVVAGNQRHKSGMQAYLIP
jgi:hypothetical protein